MNIRIGNIYRFTPARVGTRSAEYVGKLVRADWWVNPHPESARLGRLVRVTVICAAGFVVDTFTVFPDELSIPLRFADSPEGA